MIHQDKIKHFLASFTLTVAIFLSTKYYRFNFGDN